VSHRRSTALKLMGHIWDIHFPKGKPFNDEQFRLLCRDSLVLSDLFLGVADLPQDQLHRLGQAQAPAPALSPTPASSVAAEQTVEAAS
jgi:hypothetical protein